MANKPVKDASTNYDTIPANEKRAIDRKNLLLDALDFKKDVLTFVFLATLLLELRNIAPVEVTKNILITMIPDLIDTLQMSLMRSEYYTSVQNPALKEYLTIAPFIFSLVVTTIAAKSYFKVRKEINQINLQSNNTTHYED